MVGAVTPVASEVISLLLVRILQGSCKVSSFPVSNPICLRLGTGCDKSSTIYRQCVNYTKKYFIMGVGSLRQADKPP